MTPLAQKLIAIASAMTLLAGIYGFIHHQGAKSEAQKIENKSVKTVNLIQEKKNEIINLPRSDARSIDRLQRSTFFPTR